MSYRQKYITPAVIVGVNYTAKLSDEVISSAPATTITITLPDIDAFLPLGKTYTIVNCTVESAAGDTMDNAGASITSILLTGNATFYNNGTIWYVTNKFD